MNVKRLPSRRRAVPATRSAEAGAAAAETFLKALANRHRLMLLCSLVDGEQAVGDLAQQLDIAQPIVSQHLAKIRALGLVETRRAGTTIFYRLADADVAPIVTLLYKRFCAN